jgi:hypothetical protein
LPNRHRKGESATEPSAAPDKSGDAQLRKQEHFLFATDYLHDNPDGQMKLKAMALLNF